MATDLLLAAYLVAAGFSVAAAATHLYQALAQRPAALRYEGRTFAETLGHLALSFLCGPYILLRLGWATEERKDVLSLTVVLAVALVAFGWAFITGLLLVGTYLAVTG
jgi:hypothetical protein